MIAITEPSILIRINLKNPETLSEEELYKATRSKWKINPVRANKALLAFAVYEGVIQEVYKIHRWILAPDNQASEEYLKKYSVSGKVVLKSRYEFIGEKADQAIRSKYIGQSVRHYFKRGNSNPIMYLKINY